MRILDSTLRDSAYLFGGSMPLVTIPEVCKSLDGQVDLIEVGSAVSFGNQNGLYEPQNDLKRLELARSSLAETEVTTFIQPHMFKMDDIADVSATGVTLIRIGVDPEQDLDCTALVESASEYGVRCWINVMKSHLLAPRRLRQLVERYQNYENVEGFYVVDSAGCMDVNEALSLATDLSVHTRKKMGLHIHDNSRNANAIALQGLRLGMTADGTLLGRGRSGGNSDTVYLIVKSLQHGGKGVNEIESAIVRLLPSVSLLYGQDAVEKITEMMIGLSGIHSSSVPGIATDLNYGMPSFEQMQLRAWKYFKP